MAENTNGAAQNALGELFVDIKSHGLGQLVKGLNGLSAQFLLTKNAAQQAIKPIINMSQNAANSITALEKIKAVTGISYSELQDIKNFSGENNIDFYSYINQIKTAQQKLIDIKTGMSNDVQGFALLGLDPRTFDYNKPLELLDAIKSKIKDVDEVTGAAALRWFGFSEDLLYAWKQQNNTFDERLKLNEKEIESLNEQQAAWNSLNTAWRAGQEKFISNQLWINKILRESTKLISDFFSQKWNDEDFETGKEQSWVYKKIALAGKGLATLKRNIKDPNNELALNQLAEAYKTDKNVYKKYQEQKNKLFDVITDTNGDQFLVPKKIIPEKVNAPASNNDEIPSPPSVSPSAVSLLPNSEKRDLKGSAQYNIIDVTQYITGNEAQQIANDSADAIKDTVNISVYNQYTPNN